MKIEYTINGHVEVEGNGWVCYSRDTYSLTAVFDELRFAIRRNKDKTFEEIKEVVKENYKKATSRAKADIRISESEIEICKPNKTLPHVWITLIPSVD